MCHDGKLSSRYFFIDCPLDNQEALSDCPKQKQVVQNNLNNGYVNPWKRVSWGWMHQYDIKPFLQFSPEDKCCLFLHTLSSLTDVMANKVPIMKN